MATVSPADIADAEALRDAGQAELDSQRVEIRAIEEMRTAWHQVAAYTPEEMTQMSALNAKHGGLTEHLPPLEERVRDLAARVEHMIRLHGFESRLGGCLPVGPAEVEVHQHLGYERNEIAKLEATLGLS